MIYPMQTMDHRWIHNVIALIYFIRQSQQKPIATGNFHFWQSNANTSKWSAVVLMYIVFFSSSFWITYFPLLYLCVLLLRNFVLVFFNKLKCAQHKMSSGRGAKERVRENEENSIPLKIQLIMGERVYWHTTSHTHTDTLAMVSFPNTV